MRQSVVLAALAMVGISHSASADRSSCTLPADATMRIVEYFSGPPTREGDHKCNGAACSLKGWLYIPKKLDANPSQNRAVVFLHGHHKSRTEPCTIAFSFLAQGWVVFAPLRSGNTGPGITNTGKFIDDFAGGSQHPDPEKQVEFLRGFQIHDVEHALGFLAKFKFPGGKQVAHIALMGHSFGGMLAVFSSGGTFERNPEAIADIQGGELSWHDDGGVWREPLLAAVKARKVPIFFLQPRNGLSIKPTIVLSQMAALSHDNQFHAALFPPVIGGSSAEDVHSGFVDKPEAVFGWAPVVIAFFERYMK